MLPDKDPVAQENLHRRFPDARTFYDAGDDCINLDLMEVSLSEIFIKKLTAHTAFLPESRTTPLPRPRKPYRFPRLRGHGSPFTQGWYALLIRHP